MKFAKVMNAAFVQFTGLFAPNDFLGYKKLKSSIKKMSAELTDEGLFDVCLDAVHAIG